ncbi:MAG: UDP-N-acetylmuramoyl-L-alanyl-D-glutamate--2,6-diaminopimelate ligase, partial [Proteobacteria bacterium]|nr:UDP-N-acetylmuramoyl-L-alanyl-D-glutamate--2,6-diaminopimelate ligase [Pseudomonadota bacterium]
HGSFENYFSAKLKLFTDFGLPLAVLNLDDRWVKRILFEGRAKQNLTFSIQDESADFFAESVKCSVEGTQALLKTPVGDFAYRSSLIGAHNLANVLGVLATVYGLGEDLTQAIYALQTATGAPGRLERVMQGTDYPSIFVDYAHTDDALKRVLEALRELQTQKGKGRIITVFGCGGDRDKSKRPKMAKVVSQLSDLAVITSDNPRTENPEIIIDEICEGIIPNTKFHRETQRKLAIEWALSHASTEDTILIAGKGHETYQIIGKTQFPFDDREVVRDYYKR